MLSVVDFILAGRKNTSSAGSKINHCVTLKSRMTSLTHLRGMMEMMMMTTMIPVMTTMMMMMVMVMMMMVMTMMITTTMVNGIAL